MGEHALAVAAFEAALKGAKTGELLYSEFMTVRARVQAGMATKGSGPHWDGTTAKQRLSEVVGRMAGGQAGLLEKLTDGL